MRIPTWADIGVEGYLGPGPGIGGRLRARVGDFVVLEIPLRPPAGEGKYTWFRVVARNWETMRLVRALARQLGVSRRRILFAGTKDKRAITSQWMSVDLEPGVLTRISLRDVHVPEWGRDPEPVELGRLWGNRFHVLVSSPDLPPSEALEAVSEAEFPNFFGPQRFGALRPITHLVGMRILARDWRGAVELYVGETSELENEAATEARRAFMRGDLEGALELFPRYNTYERQMVRHLIRRPGDYLGALRTLPKRLLEMFLHAVQSYLFNRMLSDLVKERESPSEIEVGDAAIPVDEHGLPDQKGYIPITRHNIDLVRRRIAEGRAYLSLPLPGPRTRLTEWEEAWLGRQGLNLRTFDVPELGVRAPGRRREAHQRPRDLRAWAVPRGLYLSFSLPRGTYATSYLRELMKVEYLHFY